MPIVRGVPRLVWMALGLAAVALAAMIAIRAVRGAPIERADVGELEEPSRMLAPEIPLPELSDATESWALDTVDLGAGVDAVAGGVAVADVDGDGDLDLVAANGRAQVIPWEGTTFGTPVDLGVTDAVATAAADVDGDGRIDVLVARRGDDDAVFWGGGWIDDGSMPDVTPLASGGRSSALIAAELSGDGAVDVLRLGHGLGEGQPDVVWAADPSRPREFDPIELPSSARPSFAGEIVDVDGDGLVDIWITRDIGWETGADSLLSRRGDATGPWVDIAAELGTALEVDGMGVTIADLDGDGGLDAYVSDIGDNELLVRRDTTFQQLDGSGAARIRPPGADPSVVSSSWASGVVDLNLDGRLDLVVANGGFPDGDVPNKIPRTTIALAEPLAVLLGDGSGRFVDVWPDLGIVRTVVGRGMALADLDGDGDDDIVAMQLDGRLLALRNETAGPSIAVRAAPGCPVAGAVVTVAGDEVGSRSLLAPHTFAGAHDATVIVGTRGAPVEVEVSFPGREPVVRSASGTGRDTVVIGC